MSKYYFRKETMAGFLGLTILLMAISAVLVNIDVVSYDVILVFGIASLISAILGTIVAWVKVK